MTDQKTLHVPVPLTEMATALGKYVYTRDGLEGAYSPSLTLTVSTELDRQGRVAGASITSVVVNLVPVAPEASP
jgi:hypothetical protein